MRRALIVVLAIVSSGGACRYGMTVEEFAPAASARGVNARVTTANALLSGELIEVQQTGMLLMTARTSSGKLPAVAPECRVRFVPFTQVRAAQFDQLGSEYEISGPHPREGNVERLRLVSRFPYGLTPELLRQLLESCAQTEVAGVLP